MDFRSTNPQVPISRFRRLEPSTGQRGSLEDTPPPSIPRATRTGKACLNCRKFKSKCSGNLPRCRSCEQRNLECSYPHTRMGRMKEVTDQNTQLVALVRDIVSRSEDDEKRRINQVLEGIIENDESRRKSFGEPVATSSNSPSEAHSGEYRAPGSTGSTEGTEHLDEDLFRTHASRATGFVGQNSVVQWLRSLSHHSTSSDLPDPPVADSTFYFDSDPIETSIPVDADELPAVDTAERLFNLYVDTIHRMFPLVPKVFQEQFRKLFLSLKQGQPNSMPERWQAMLNLVFAIAARHCHLVRAEWSADESDHSIYMNRAMRLLERSSGNNFLLSTPDLLLIETTGLLSLYYLVIGHVSKAWIMIGISIRYAVAVGMHIRNDDRSTPPERKDDLVRTWWSLQLIECLLSSMVGRPCVISDDHCTVPMIKHLVHETGRPDIVPHDVSFSGMSGMEEDFSFAGASSTFNTSHLDTQERSCPSYLEARVQVSLITQKALSLLYAPPIASYSWTNVRKSIRSLIIQLDKWIPATSEPGLDELYRDVEYSPRLDLHRERLLLLFQVFSTRILITRPFLCRLGEGVKHQSTRSTQLGDDFGASCVQAAHDLTGLLPDQPYAEWVYRNGPWWCIVHNIMQAVTVFLVELSKRETGTENTSDAISVSLKKLFRWVRAMQNKDPVARRAYKIVFDILKTSAQYFRIDIADLLAEEQAGIGHSSAAESGESYLDFMSDSNSWQHSQQPQHSIDRGFAGPPLNVEDSQQPPLSRDDMDLQFDFILDQYQTPPLYGNPYATPFDSHTGSRWSPSFDSFVEFQGMDEQHQDAQNRDEASQH